MKAALLEHAGRIEDKPPHLRDVPEPTPVGTEIVIKVPVLTGVEPWADAVRPPQTQSHPLTGRWA
jgi:hypothetical protein